MIFASIWLQDHSRVKHVSQDLSLKLSLAVFYYGLSEFLGATWMQ